MYEALYRPRRQGRRECARKRVRRDGSRLGGEFTEPDSGLLSSHTAVPTARAASASLTRPAAVPSPPPLPSRASHAPSASRPHPRAQPFPPARSHPSRPRPQTPKRRTRQSTTRCSSRCTRTRRSGVRRGLLSSRRGVGGLSARSGRNARRRASSGTRTAERGRISMRS